MAVLTAYYFWLFKMDFKLGLIITLYLNKKHSTWRKYLKNQFS
jgi:hypothetical protein